MKQVYENPTPMTLGLKGNLAGREYSVAGRMVMGTEENGETYYWHEFHLVAADGLSALLVREEAERVEEWRLFTPFDPEVLLKSDEAQTKCVGDTLEMDGKVMVIDRVGDSTVHFIQGDAPKGVKVGDVARYFNARSGRSMAVVSWTGSEVEYFRGMDLYRGLVSIAFRWPPQSSRSKSVTSGLNFNPMTAWVIGVLGLLMVVGVVIGSSSCRSNFAGNPGPKKPAAVSRLKLGSSGNVRGMNYRVVRHDVIECAQVASISDRNEYHLVSDGRADDLLVEGWLEDSSAWALLERVYSNPSLTPIQAGGIQAGDVVSIDGERLDVQSLVLITLIRTEGDDHNSDAPSGIRQGLVAIAGAMSYLVRWTPDQLETYRVKILPSALIRDALGK